MGDPSEAQTRELTRLVGDAISQFKLRLGRDVTWHVGHEDFHPQQNRTAAVMFFGGATAPLGNTLELLARGIPIIPVVSTLDRVQVEIPLGLRFLNCLAYDVAGPYRAAATLLECAGLLPRQRRVFVSYKRDEAREAALQLFDEFSDRLFDVFLDTRGIPPAEDIEAVLWHRLCDSDVLVMLDTPHYFESRWTAAEFGRALAKGIAVLRIGWPDCTPSTRTETASRAELIADEVDASSGRLSAPAIARICEQLEIVRSQSHAVRNLNLISGLRCSVEQIGGAYLGSGALNAVSIRLPDGQEVCVYPIVGVPTSTTLHNAVTNSPQGDVAVLFDHVGLRPDWLAHLEWLGSQVKAARWVKANEAAWAFAGWRV